HARIRAIDVSAARRAPGVVGVFTAADLGGAGEPMPIYAPHPALPVPCRIRPLATDRARFVGEAVVAVIADSVYRAHDALDLVRVDYEPLPAVVDVEAALAPGAPRLHDELATNVAAEWRQRVGDVEAAFPTADVRVRTRIRLAPGPVTRPADQVDRDATRAHAGRVRGARPDPRRRDRGDPRREDRRSARRLSARHGRLHDLRAEPAAERDDPLGRALCDPTPR